MLLGYLRAELEEDYLYMVSCGKSNNNVFGMRTNVDESHGDR